jgi:hypothetical protein
MEPEGSLSWSQKPPMDFTLSQINTVHTLTPHFFVTHLNIILLSMPRRSRVSSGSVVSDYGLDDRAIRVRSPAGAKGFPLSSVSRPALGPTQPPVQWVPGVLSPGLKCGRNVMLTTHPHLVPRSRMSRSYTSSPPSAFMACSGTALDLSMPKSPK